MRAGSYSQATSGKMRLLPRLLERCESRRPKGALPCRRLRRRNKLARRMRTAPAARPVAMPATEAFFNCVLPEPDEAAAVADDDADELVEDEDGWLAAVTKV